MNDVRRKELKHAIDLIQEAMDIINSVRDEEYQSLNNLPESIMYGKQGSMMSDIVDSLEDQYIASFKIVDSLYDLIIVNNNSVSE